MLTRSLFLSLFIVLLTSCASTDSCVEDLTGENFSVTLKKGACLGKCPVYGGTVYGDASVLFEGRMNVDRLGRYSGSISNAELCRLKTFIEESGFMQMKEDQTAPVMDAPQSEISVKMTGQLHTVRWNIKMPEELVELQALLIAATRENSTLTKVESDSGE